MRSDLLFLHFRPRENRVPSVWRPSFQSVPGQRERTFWIMSHEVQLSPAASNHPTATLPSRPSWARAPRCRPGAAELLRPGQAPSAVTPRIPAWVVTISVPRHRCPAAAETGTVEPTLTVKPPSRHPPAEPARPGRDLPAKLATAIDLRCTSDVPGTYLPWTCTTTGRTPRPRPCQRIRFCRACSAPLREPTVRAGVRPAGIIAGSV